MDIRALILHVTSAFIFSGSPALAAPQTATIDWKPLFEICESNWEKYDTDLIRLRGTLQRQFDAMSKEEFLKRYMNDDMTIRFVRVHWPSMFSKKDSGWSIYLGCAERNSDTRKILSSAGATHDQRQAKIDDFESCVRPLFAPRGPMPQPFARLLACYRKHNK